MMPPMLVCFPADPANAAVVAAGWQAEFAALAALGVPLAPLDEQFAMPPDRTVAAQTLVVWRGAALTAPEYSRLEAAIRATGLRMFTPTQDYLRAHHLPGWLPTLLDHTAATQVVPASHLARLPTILEKLDRWPLAVRDYAHSAASPAAPASNAAEVSAAVAQISAEFGAVEGGICLRRAESFIANSQCRFFIWHQNVWPHPSAPEDAVALARLSARHFWHPFYCVDIAQREDGRWRVQEIDDAQVAERREWTPAHFATCLRPSLQPHLA